MLPALRGEEIAAQVLNASGGGGASIKKYFKLDTVKFSWVDDYLRDEALRKKIQGLNDKINEMHNSPMHKDELRALFESTIDQINNERRLWFEEKLKAVQNRKGRMIYSDMLIYNASLYISPIGLSKGDIDQIFANIPEGVKQADITTAIGRMQEEVAEIEAVIEKELSPRSRWLYREDGEPFHYPQGCRWTQYVNAWKKIAQRFDGPVSAEGVPVQNEHEEAAYYALGLDKIQKLEPLRKPGQVFGWANSRANDN